MTMINDDDNKTTQKCIKFLVSGRVQGVFFRDSTRQQANRLGLSGYAINLPDGRVEVLACGKKAHLDQLFSWLETGPDMAYVTDIKLEPVTIDAAMVPQQFTIG